MLSTRFFATAFSAGLTVLGAGVTSGQQNYPNKPIRIVTGGIGAGGDVVSRLVAPEILGALGQPVIVENRQGIINGEVVARATPDGYTLLIAANTFLYAPLLEKLSFDPVRDFAPISLLVRAPTILVVHPSVPAKSTKELIGLAKAKPRVLNYASGGTGGTSHLTAELFNSMAGINIVRIPYKGTGLSMNALLAGEEVHLMFDNGSALMPLVKAGKLRGLGVTTAQPSALVPGLPTIAESLPGFEASTIFTMFAPAKTPAAILDRLNQEVVRIVNRADMKEKFLGGGLEVVGSSRKELAATVTSEIAKMGKVIKEAGIRAE